MNKFLFILSTISLLAATTSLAQRLCGNEAVNKTLIAKDPAWAQKLEAQRASLQPTADRYKQQQASGASKTTAASPIPVIFHFMVTEAQLAQIGGIAGLEQRINSQIQVLNEDYNRENADSALIPSGWKPLYASAGIRFALAHTSPSGHGTPGYELKIIPNLPGGFSGVSSGYTSAKHESSGGFNSWDVTKYLNIWCTAFTDYPSLLGFTVSKSKTGVSGFPVNEIGVCALYASIGRRAAPSDYYLATGYMTNYYDRGRSLTHELGHFFEIWHTWGDDNGKCPWDLGGLDDGLADTPPESDKKYYAYPYNIPGGTYIDSCHHMLTVNMQPIGVASLDFMNYTDDVAMHLFTPDQVAVMASQVAGGGQHYSLTQNPGLLNWSPITGIAGSEVNTGLHIYPNPSNGTINIICNETISELKQVSITNIIGQVVHSISTQGQNRNYYSINLSHLDKGIYFVRCNFASESITRKILLQ